MTKKVYKNLINTSTNEPVEVELPVNYNNSEMIKKYAGFVARMHIPAPVVFYIPTQTIQ